MALLSDFRKLSPASPKTDNKRLSRQIRLQRAATYLYLKRALVLSELKRHVEAVDSLQDANSFAKEALLGSVELLMECTLRLVQVKVRRIQQIYRADNNFVLTKQDFIQIGDEATKTLASVKLRPAINTGTHRTFLNLRDSYANKLKEQMHSFLEIEDKERLLRLRQMFPIMKHLKDTLVRFGEGK